jgi:hypothetical protein
MAEDAKWAKLDWFADVAGQRVERGDRVAYAVSKGSMAELVMGTVIDIEFGRPYSYSSYERHRITVKGDNREKPSRLEYPSRIVRVRSARETELDEHPARVITFGSTHYED